MSYYSYELKIVGTMPQYLLKCKFIAQIHKSICILHLQLFLSYGVWANKLNWIVIHDSKRAIYLSGSDNIHLTLTIFKKWSIFKLLMYLMSLDTTRKYKRVSTHFSGPYTYSLKKDLIEKLRGHIYLQDNNAFYFNWMIYS